MTQLLSPSSTYNESNLPPEMHEIMATPPPRSSWKAKLDRLNHSSFIGRREQLATFRASLTDPETRANIVAVSGQGGVGKTTLLKEFRRIAEKQEKNIVA
jgi:Flp pilus assembly CpaF family ATPase